jgi:hypothetical protein
MNTECIQPTTLRYLEPLQVSIGIGKTQTSEFLGALGIPFRPHKTFHKNEKRVSELWSDTAMDNMKMTAEEEKELAIEENRIDAKGIPEIMVTADRAWSKRSYGHKYSSLSGLAAIVGYNTQKVLFMGVRNRFFSVCAYAKRNKKAPKDHPCCLNWAESPAAMEADILVEGFSTSIETHGLKYSYFVGD